jgi:hypothetical protein
VFDQERVAKLTGEAWLEFVITHGGEVLTGHVGRSMLATAFGNLGVDERAKWFEGAEGFVRRARQKRRSGMRGDTRGATARTRGAGAGVASGAHGGTGP